MPRTQNDDRITEPQKKMTKTQTTSPLMSQRASIQDLETVQRRTMIVLSVMQVVGTVGVGIAPSIGVLLAGQVTDNEAWAGLARTSSTLGAALLGLPLGNFAARRGRRVALASGWWVAAAGAGLLVAAAQWSLVVPLFVGLLLIGAGSAVSLQARFAATDIASPRHRARSLALIVWVGTIGSVLGPNLGVPGEAIGRATGLTVFAAAFLIAAGCLALAGALVFGLLRPDPLLLAQSRSLDEPGPQGSRVSAPTAGPGRSRAMLAELGRNPAARLAVVAILTSQLVMVAIMTMTPVHVAHEGGSVTFIGLTISLHIVGMYGFSPVVGIAADRIGHHVTIAIGLALFAGSLAIGILQPNDMGWMMASLILLGLGWSFVSVGGSALFSVAESGETRAASQGGLDALSNLFGAAAAFAAGPILMFTSFSALAVIALIALVPLTVLTAITPKGNLS
ncbi:MFS transporter [Arthrobacter sp. NtRootA1]|uniref:MFS transporter n=1 Tax=Micrococcaceae TaxID=1268 RepID=UPI001CC82559|nr:MFS transporter [Arthrobacter sp. NtRootA1]